MVPCFNEQQRLRSDAFIQLATTPDVCLLFVDDGSRDATPRTLADIKALSPSTIDWFSQPNGGKASAVRAGMLRAIHDGAQFVGFLDADLATPVSEAIRLVRASQIDTLDAVLGSRVALLGHAIERSALRHLVGRAFATAASLTLGLRVYDTQCGAKVFRVSDALKCALADPFRSRWAFDVELLGRLLIGGQDVAPVAPSRFREIPLIEWRDVAGSKLTTKQMLASALDLLLITYDLSARRARARRSRPSGRSG